MPAVTRTRANLFSSSGGAHGGGGGDQDGVDRGRQPEERDGLEEEEQDLRVLNGPKMRVDVTFVAKAMSGLPMLTFDNFDIWTSAVGDGMYAAGLGFVFAEAMEEKYSGSSPTKEQLQEYHQALQVAWSILRKTLMDLTPVYTKTARIPRGDVAQLLKTVRDFVQKRTIVSRTDMRRKVASLSMADFKDLRAYVEGAEALFSKAERIGVKMDDDEMVYLILEGLSPEYIYIRHMIMAHEDFQARPPSFAKVVAMLENFADITPRPTTKRGGDTTFATKARPTRRPHEGVDVRTRERTREPVKGDCWEFQQRGQCAKTNCKYRHIVGKSLSAAMASGEVQSTKPVVNKNDGKKKKDETTCWNCGKTGHKKAECRSKPREREEARLVVQDWNATIYDKVSISGPMTTTYNPSEFLIDSGSTCHVIGEHMEGLRNIRKAEISIEVGGRNRLECKATCTADISLPNGARLTLKDARLVPGFGRNVISEGLLSISGLTIQRRGRQFEALLPDGRPFIRLPMESGSSLVVLRGLCGVDKKAEKSGEEISRNSGENHAQSRTRKISGNLDHTFADLDGQQNLSKISQLFEDQSSIGTHLLHGETGVLDDCLISSSTGSGLPSMGESLQKDDIFPLVQVL
jgi:gag-polypeptide of LTR copia-type/Zinc knuckle